MIEQKPAVDNWDRHWDSYAEAASLNPAQRMRHAAIMGALRRVGRPLANLLDVGSGQGDFLTLALATKIAKNYAGFEMSASGVRIGTEKVPGAEFLQVDLFAPPLEAKRFEGWADAVVCSDVIEHVDEPVAFLTALRGYLAVDGTLVLTVPGGPMSKFDHHIGHRRHYTRKLMKDTLTQAGFEVKFVQLAGFPFFNLYRLVVIARGDRLIEDVDAQDRKAIGPLARATMASFRLLFKLNLADFPLGWQVVAIATKPKP